MTSQAIHLTVAGEHLIDGAAELCRYLTRRATVRTIRGYDLLERPRTGSFTPGEITATRLMSSRISHTQGERMIKVSESLDWHGLSVDNRLVDADPNSGIGLDLYRRASHVYEQLVAGSEPGIGVAKRHKLLHLQLPGLVPILDSQLLRAYREPARAMARRHPELCQPFHPGLRAQGRRYTSLPWLAVREDLWCPSNQSALKDLRDWLLRSGLWQTAGFTTDELDGITDLRLLDMATWRALRP